MGLRDVHGRKILPQQGVIPQTFFNLSQWKYGWWQCSHHLMESRSLSSTRVSGYLGGGNAVTTGGSLEACPHHESVEIWVVAMQ